MAVARPPPPFILEDRTGLLVTSDFDDIYDRLFLRVAEHTPLSRLSTSPPPSIHRTLLIFDMLHRWSPRRDHAQHNQRPPRAIMQFGAHDTLGTVEFVLPGLEATMHMTKYLQKTSLFASSLSRQFVGSDGHKYRWGFHATERHEWACFADDHSIIATYDLRPPGQPLHLKSGNILTIQEEYGYLAVELLASLLIMRHIQQHHL